MNVFEFLGLPEEHRKLKNKVTQLVKHWDEVPVSRKDGKDLVVQVKRDGVCALTVVREDGKVGIFSRTGNRFTNTESLVSHATNVMPIRAGVYMGEMWLPKEIASLEEVSGMTNPNRVNQLDARRAILTSTLRMSFFDFIELDEFTEGRSATPYFDRHEKLTYAFVCGGRIFDILPYECAPDEAAIEFNLQDQIKKGEEGIVIRDIDAGWEAGHKGWRVMKMVRGVDYDLECIGFEEGEGKYEGKVANLLFKWKGGKTIKAMLGKGWTHMDAQQMFQNTARLKGTIFQVYALEESSKGKLRLPKVGELRHDKLESDV